MRATLYLRQSMDRAGDELAVTRQRQACEQLCAQRGWSVQQVITDNDTSATKGIRKGFTELLKLIETGKVDVVVCYHADRLARSLVDLERVISLCEKSGAKLATVSGDLDLSTDMGRLVARILASVAKGEVERKSGRQRDANQQHAELGRPPSGPVPFGFLPNRVEHHPEQAAAIRRAYDDVLAGASLASVARRWNAEGLLSGRVRTSTLDKGAPSQWSAETVRTLLLKPRNAGIRRHKGEDYPAIWQPIVEQEVWLAAVAHLTAPGRRGAPPTPRRLLSGVALCGVCGAEVNSGLTRRAGGYHSYRCRRSLGHVARRGDWVDEFISEMVIERLSRPDAIDLLADDRPDVDVPALRAQAVALRGRLETLAVEFAEDEDVTPAQLRVATRRIRDRLEGVEAALAEAGRVNVLAALIGADDVRAVWDGMGERGEHDRQRAVIDALLMIVVHPVGRGARRFDASTVWSKWRAEIS